MHAQIFRASLRREWQLLRRRPWDVAMISWVPLLSVALIWWIFSNGIPTRLPVGVWDADHSALSRQLVRFLDATPGLQVVARYDDEWQVEQSMRAGRVYGVVEIPREFARDVKRGHAAQVTLLHNAQFSSHSGIIQRDVRTAVGTLSAGIEIVARNKRGEPLRAARLAAEPIRASLANLFNPSLDYLQFLGMALIPALLHIFAMAAGAWSVGTELRDATIGEWRNTAMQGQERASFFAALLGKLSIPFISLSAAGVSGLLAVIIAGGMHPAGSLVFTLLALMAMLALSIALGAVVAAVTRSLRTALSVTGIVTAPAFAFSGAAFPLSAMPARARLWADSLPFTHYLRVQIEQLQMGAPMRYSLPALVWMPAVTLALLLAAACALAKAAQQPDSWGAR
ncbi:ABC transporter permease [Noviherbaspirillum sp. UKPF54]|uniref:ABC transporter permease n=1 Tax=Noviherbaspirillum sp. UKPF54 TaxID=2601898 RepID=UPI0011B0FFFC|nr:ABC transporter permease [Noviherbaspirillum sp. UKPF54]QDZ27096.1 ABC transporter permease [Noviherbaspirillum sp. UKPF54]